MEEQNPTQDTKSEILVRGDANPPGSGFYFQEDNPGPYSNEHPAAPTTDFYSTADVDVFLKRTGSQGDFIITQSAGVTGAEIYSGSVITFNEEILGIYNNITASTNTSSTQNVAGDLYYIEYSMSNFTPGVIGGSPVTSQNIAFETNSDTSILYITQSSAGGGGGNFNATGSLILRQSNLNSPTEIGNVVANIPFNIPDGSTIDTVDVEGSFINKPEFKANDIFRFSIELNKEDLSSGLVISEITASIIPSQSVWSPISPPIAYDNYRVPTSELSIISNFYGNGVLPFNLALDCQPLFK